MVGGAILPADHPLAAVKRTGHFSVAVDNIDQAVAELRSHGVSIHIDVISVRDRGHGAPPLDKAAFIADPWGNVIELVQLPKQR